MEEANNSQQDSKIEPLKLKIDAHVVTQLGAELITGPEIALVELIKNSYDADASYCDIDIQPEATEVVDGRTYHGKIVIKDNGHGMTRNTINKAWLTISHSEKREAKRAGSKTSKFSRSYTGDKGLGRLGSMQLGDVCRINTKTSSNDSEGIVVTFRWSDFKPGTTLDSVKITERKSENNKKAGSAIEIIGLNDLGYWKDDKRLNKLKYKLSSMVSPFGHLKNFKLYLKVSGASVSLETFNEKIYDLCTSEYSFELNENTITVNGKLKLNGFEPSSKEEKELFNNYILSDQGFSLLEFLKSSNKLNDFSQIKSEDEKYFIEFKREIELDDISATKKKFKAVKDKESNFTNPGNFDGKIYQFVFRKNSLDLDDNQISYTETKTLIQELTGGVAAYRDGFKIGSRNIDWLGLASEMTSGAGGYSLRPSNVAGFINLTWDNNKRLQEKSDRESFVDNDAYDGFWIICQEIIKSINNYLNTSRRESLQFIKNNKDQNLGKPKTYSAQHALNELGNLSKSASTVKDRINKETIRTKRDLEQSISFIDETIKTNENSLISDPIFGKQMQALRSRVDSLERQFNDYAQQYSYFSEEISDHLRSVERIEEEIESYEQQISDFYDHVAIGISAEDLAHEANSQLGNISFHLNASINRVKDLGIQDKDLMRHLLSIRSDTGVISKTISSLNPLVRAQRSSIDTLYLSKHLSEYFDLRSSYFEENKVKVVITSDGKDKPIRFNRGKLFQVIDNLVRNSQHWLEVFNTHNPNTELSINVEVIKNTFTIYDSGKGVREGIENNLFDMFVSDKDKGQGLGLYITRRLLEERGCSIILSPERNKFGRRFKFKVDLIGATE